MVEARKLAGKILGNGPLAVRLALESALRGRSLPLDEALRYEANLFGLVSATADMREGLRAFLDKRPADFRNE
jgi:enoyl-CoA hydratase